MERELPLVPVSEMEAVARVGGGSADREDATVSLLVYREDAAG